MKTPYYLIQQEKLDTGFEKLRKAIDESWNNYIIGYSYKTNSLPWVVQHFDSLGCYAEVVSEEEYRLAEEIGAGNRIIYNGPIKTKNTFCEAIRNGAVVNIDSHREIDWLDEFNSFQVRIGIRVNFNIEKLCPGQSQCGDEGGRFGFCYENGELEKAIKQIELKGHKITGLHLHTSSKTRSLDIYKAIAEMVCIIKEKYRLELSYIDIGGGFFGGLETKPQFHEYFSLISKILKKDFSPDQTTLIVEPGMAVIGAPVSYVSSVIDVKDTELNRFVVTDGTRTSIDPLMKKQSYFCFYRQKKEAPRIAKQVICGYTCMENDRLFTAINAPELCPGDQIVYEKVGAYTMCLTPLFIKYFPDVYVENGNEVKKVRSAWEIEEYIQKSVVEG